MSGRLYIPVGIPGSGKSTWTKRMLNANSISSDDIREEMFGSLKAAHDPLKKRVNNDRVWAQYYSTIEDLLGSRTGIIADATNLRDFARARLRDIADRQGAETHVIIFNNPHQALKRNKERPDDEIVPDPVMADFEHQLSEAIFDIEEKESYTTITRIQCVN